MFFPILIIDSATTLLILNAEKTSKYYYNLRSSLLAVWTTERRLTKVVCASAVPTLELERQFQACYHYLLVTLLTVLVLWQLTYKTNDVANPNVTLRILFVLPFNHHFTFTMKIAFSYRKNCRIKLQLQVLKEESDSFWKRSKYV